MCPMIGKVTFAQIDPIRDDTNFDFELTQLGCKIIKLKTSRHKSVLHVSMYHWFDVGHFLRHNNIVYQGLNGIDDHL